ncbi:hypothetical protein [Yoonia sp. MH D7]
MSFVPEMTTAFVLFLTALVPVLKMSEIRLLAKVTVSGASK